MQTEQKNPSKLRRQLTTVGTGAGALALAAHANAAALDVTGVTTAITENGSSMNTVAVAVIGFVVLVMVVNGIRRLIR